MPSRRSSSPESTGHRKLKTRRMAPVLGIAVLVLVYGCADGRKVTAVLTVPNGGPWGDWHPIEMCPDRQYAVGFSLKVDPPEGIADDTSLNGIRLVCAGPNKENQRTIESGVGKWGAWTPVSWCPGGFMRSFILRMDPYHGSFYDDTAANNIKSLCTKGPTIEGIGLDWGRYGPMSELCKKGICGLQTKIDPPRWFTDQTGLNDVKMFCCDD
ncbi:vitelline membrane outer layer protein 1 homolog isoform X1 [Ambystoma mexicanum]|uniref:vitelline membrane outer layer protein 1 homolog isoform X1 n=1 Tax=Ambystoma mexicanum TaxID=8296 RepID=UPI0037E74EC5